MGSRLSGVVCVLAVVSLPSRAPAQEVTLTLEGALQRARERALPFVSAESRVDEARARLRGATAIRDNPVLEAAIGRRPEAGAAADFEVGLSQTFELGGRRGGRIAAAEAGVQRESAAVAEARSRALRDVAVAFLRGVAAAERVRLARAAESYGEDVQRVAERRYAAGDVAVLDVNLARGATARARSEVRAALAGESLAQGDLRALLALEADVPLRLVGASRPGPAPELAALLADARTRADVEVADAELRAAGGEIALGRGLRWPEVTPSVRLEREAGANVLWGGLTFSLPVWNRGQEARGVAEARESRLRLELEAIRRTALVEVRSAHQAYQHRIAALRALDEAAPGFEENEALARRSYEVGQIGLAELLLVRRETLEAQLLRLDRSLEAGEAEIDLLAKAGVLR